MTPVLMTTDAVGGVWQYSLDLARALVPLGYRTVLVVLGPAPSTAQATAARAIAGLTVVETGLALDWLATDADEIAAAARAVAALAQRHPAARVQFNAPALAAFVRSPVPTVAVAHSCVATWWAAVGSGALPADFAWRADLHRAGLEAADVAVAPSAAFAAATASAYGLAAPGVVHNGRATFVGRGQGWVNAAFTAGRLWDAGKNVAVLDRAAARTAVPVHAAGAVAAPGGRPASFAHLRLLGSVDEATLGDWLGRRPVFVSAARYEPFGLAVLEAAAAGCALVLSDIPSFRELWADAAVFVAPDDDRGFAAAIDGLVGDAGRRQAMGAAAAARAARYTPAAAAAAMAAIYAGLVAAPGLSAHAA